MGKPYSNPEWNTDPDVRSFSGSHLFPYFLSMANLLCLISPPASGKTFWIESFAAASEAEILVISPLRALADECLEKWSGRIAVMTPEEWLLKKTQKARVIFDEFHLFFYWGDSFRPRMWEVFFALAAECDLCVLLTATVPPWMRPLINDFRSHFDEILWCDFGNQSLKYAPIRYLRAPSECWLNEHLFTFPPGELVQLVFCRYRRQVQELGAELVGRGFRVWTCVGGEAQGMRRLVASGETPHFIVATTVLSHGVNLPEIARIIFLYPVKNTDFWIQMVARGGRRGGTYEVFALEPPHNLPWSLVRNFFSVKAFELKHWGQKLGAWLREPWWLN